MCESTVADCRSGDRREPAVKYREFQGEGRQDRQICLFEVVHDLLRVLHVAALIEVALYEALHVGLTVGRRIATKYLEIHCREMMVRIWIELALKFRQCLWFDARPGRVRIAELVCNAIDPRIDGFQRSQHVVKGA